MDDEFFAFVRGMLLNFLPKDDCDRWVRTDVVLGDGPYMRITTDSHNDLGFDTAHARVILMYVSRNPEDCKLVLRDPAMYEPLRQALELLRLEEEIVEL